jgi:lipid II:glycine glycyltransferase (peptidoglycan interpeptide bridge formation enzyme)
MKRFSPSTQVWNKVAQESSYATFFHTPAWARIVTETFPSFFIATQAFELDDGEIAIFPLVASKERNRFFLWFESVYLGSYGGPIANRALTPNEMQEIFRLLFSYRVANLHLIENPFASHQYPDYLKSSTQFTHLLKLGDIENVTKTIEKDRRRQIRKAEEAGLSVTIAENESDILEYYKVYEDTLKRWGDKTLVRYSQDLFLNLFHHGSQSVRFWLCKLNDKLISGKIRFYHNNTIISWHGASLESFKNYHPDPFLVYEVIKDGCIHGYQFLDMGPSGNLKGVENFKDEFGAEKLFFKSFEWGSNPTYLSYKKYFLRK